MARNQNRKLQLVYPKEGIRGKSGHRGFFGRLNDVLTGRGPDLFLQTKGDREAIRVDQWANWDSYHSPQAHFQEASTPHSSRGIKRYDPHSRRYKTWATPIDWDQQGTDGRGIGENGEGYLRFTATELAKMNRTTARGKRIDPRKMGSDWNWMGPKRFRPEHDWFWQEAYRCPEWLRGQGLTDPQEVNPNLRMGQRAPFQLAQWYREA